MGVVGDEVRLRSAVAREVGARPHGLEFVISSRRLANGTFVVAAGGEVDLYTAPELERVLAGPLAEGTARLVVDLSEARSSTPPHSMSFSAQRGNSTGTLVS